MDDCFACMYLRMLHACLVSKKVEEGVGCPGLELQGLSVTMRMLGTEPQSLQEEQVLLTAELSNPNCLH